MSLFGCQLNHCQFVSVVVNLAAWSNACHALRDDSNFKISVCLWLLQA